MAVDTGEILLQLILLILCARLFGGLAYRLGMPAVLGEMLAGIVLGPSLLGWIELNSVLRVLADVAVILLLFEVGTDTDFGRLMHSGLRSLLVALVGFFAPLLLGFAVSYWVFGLPTASSWFIGGTLTATSIGITMRVLRELGQQDTDAGRVVLGAAVMDDVLGVLLLAMLYDVVNGTSSGLAHSANVLLLVLGFVVMAPLGARIMVLLIERYDQSWRRPGLIPASTVAMVLFCAWLAGLAGVPELLGGFAAGLALSGHFTYPTRFRIPDELMFDRRVREQMLPFVHLLTPAFFVAVGLSLDLRAVRWDSSFVWLLSLTLLLVAVFGKLLGGMLMRGPRRQRWIIGISMVPRGEVGLVFAELGRAAGIVNQESYAALLIVIAATTLFPALVLRQIVQSATIADSGKTNPLDE